MGKKIHPQEETIRTFALTFPGSHEDFPWGESAIKVKGKAFVFMSNREPTLSLSVKIPMSKEIALGFPWAQPTAYGLGKAGWVSCSFEPGEKVPMEMLRSFVAESYQAVAPKTLLKQLTHAPAAARPRVSSTKKTKTKTKKKR